MTAAIGDGFSVVQDTVAHTATHAIPARWTWHPDSPTTVRLVISYGDAHEVLSFGRGLLHRVVTGVVVPEPDDPECWAHLGVHHGRRVLHLHLTHHPNPDQPPPRRQGLPLWWWTSTATTLRFLAATTRVMPPCGTSGYCPLDTPCRECHQSRQWVAGLAAECLSELPPPPQEIPREPHPTT